ncbi:TPA: hypothetical protein ACPY5O_003939 [Yersinia enterocolitica]|uniref:hypothetical protein n=1 Tax=Yersinia intermedia TaxID=631 RepID=UPI0005E40AF4|nr:hypothetical protein [Yersinia intermedia]EKN4708880.1 hypothetical protein [Yersinia enterocolitica]EKN6146948.1 hypothetical protein [Yersinia enterocolitica]CNI09254.1 Uncharacterised protein [Yersinia intermedia]
MSMWDDFRAFDLRREDWVYEKPEQHWGEITMRYRFFSFSGKKLPCDMFDLLNDLYKKQVRSGDRDFARARTHSAYDKNIDSDLISRDLKKMLISAIADKEQALAYLTTHYREVVKQHGQSEILTFSFHLPDNWHPEDEVQTTRKLKGSERLIPALNELKRRFTALKKKITSDRLYTAASGYSRLIVLSQQSEPFYVVNFFFKKNKQNRIGGNLPLDIYDKWMDTGEKKHRSHEQVKYFCLENAAWPERASNDRLFIRAPAEITDNGQIEYVIEKMISDDNLIKNTRKGYLDFFRIQAQIYNPIPGIRTLTNSDDFTYLNAEIRKKRKVKKTVAKAHANNSPRKVRKKIPSGECIGDQATKSDVWVVPATYLNDAL